MSSTIDQKELQKLKDDLRERIQLVDRNPRFGIGLIRNAIIRGWFLQKRLVKKGSNEPRISLDEWTTISTTSIQERLKVAVEEIDLLGYLKHDSEESNREVKWYAFTETAMEAIEQVLNEPELAHSFDPLIPGSDPVNGFALIEYVYLYRTNETNLAGLIANAICTLIPMLTYSLLDKPSNACIVSGPNNDWDFLLAVIPNQGILPPETFNQALNRLYPKISIPISIGNRNITLDHALIIYPSVDGEQAEQINDDPRLYGMSAFSVLRFIRLLQNFVHDLSKDEYDYAARFFMTIFNPKVNGRFAYPALYAVDRLKENLSKGLAEEKKS